MYRPPVNLFPIVLGCGWIREETNEPGRKCTYPTSELAHCWSIESMIASDKCYDGFTDTLICNVDLQVFPSHVPFCSVLGRCSAVQPYAVEIKMRPTDCRRRPTSIAVWDLSVAFSYSSWILNESSQYFKIQMVLHIIRHRLAAQASEMTKQFIHVGRKVITSDPTFYMGWYILQKYIIPLYGGVKQHLD